MLKIPMSFVNSPSNFFSLVPTGNGYFYELRISGSVYKFPEEEGVRFKRDVISLSDKYRSQEIKLGEFLKRFKKVAALYGVH